MSLLNLFHISYYFDNNLGSTFTGFWFALVVASLLIMASVIDNIKSKRGSYFYRQIAVRATQIGSIVGWIGLIWLFFRYEGIPYFTWRVWPALLFIYVLVALYYLVRFIKVDYPERQKQRGSRADKDIYLRKFLGK